MKKSNKTFHKCQLKPLYETAEEIRVIAKKSKPCNNFVKYDLK